MYYIHITGSYYSCCTHVSVWAHVVMVAKDRAPREPVKLVPPNFCRGEREKEEEDIRGGTGEPLICTVSNAQTN